MRSDWQSCSIWAGKCCVHDGMIRRVRFAPGAQWVLPILLAAPALHAQQVAAKFDPAASSVKFTLGATLHTVHGTFKMKSGEIRVDEGTGAASGTIIVDATTAGTDNSSRDHKMHTDVLESAKFPEIVFAPKQISAASGQSLKTILEGKGTGQVQAAGIFRLHSQEHEITLNLSVENDGKGQVHLTGTFPVPYVKWGLKNPSTFVLRVSDTVSLELDARAEISAAH